MPSRDRIGPLGLGPRTGRAMGYCAGFGMHGSANPIPGRGGFGFGRGRGRGSGRGLGWSGRGRSWRCQYWATGLPGWIREGYGYPLYEPELKTKEEITVLQNQADFLKRQLEEIQNRIDTLEKGKKQESE